MRKPTICICENKGADQLRIIISIIMKHLLPETAWPIKAKLHMEHPWEGEKKVYINGQGHMIKMAAMAINRKKL